MRVRDSGCGMSGFLFEESLSFLSGFTWFAQMSYKNLEVWKIARELSILAHEMSLTLPKFELFEEGSQIRRSSKSARINIVEGYGRRRYKGEFVKFLTYAHASNDETVDHLETLWETHSLRIERFMRVFEHSPIC